MADTCDRRSLILSNDPVRVKARRRYHALVAAGLCAKCGKTEVRKRTTCYDCVDRNMKYRGYT